MIRPPQPAPPYRRHPLEHASAFLAGRPAGVSELLAALVGMVDDRPALHEFMRSLIDDPAQIGLIARRSYWHPNGFAKLVLHVDPASAFRVRLHIWPPGPGRRGETNPHSHRWNFASTVLTGDGLALTAYEESDTGTAFVRYRYARNGEADHGPRLTRIGAVALRPVARRTVRTSDNYTTETSAVHTVDPLGCSLVATLVVQGPHCTDSTIVYCIPGSPADQQERVLVACEVRLLVGEMLAAVDPKGSARR